MKPWSAREESILRKSAGKASCSQIAKHLGRSERSIWRRAHNLRISLRSVSVCADCEKSFATTNQHMRCSKCSKNRNVRRMKKWQAQNREYQSVTNHFYSIFKNTNSNYAGMPFFDGWNPDKGGSFQAGADWIVKNLGRRPKGSTLHVIHHDIGFMPGNLEWAHPRKQSNQQMFRIIAQQRHEIKIVKRQLIEAQQVIALAA